MGAWLLLTHKTSSYFKKDEGVENVRAGFWRGIITGSIIGAAVSMMAAGRHRQERKGFLGQGSKHVRSRAHRMLRGVSRTVNDLIK